jgi:hypothetical protein
MTPLQIWAAAIQSAEGWYPGSASYTNNNPGNLSYAAAVEWSLPGLVGESAAGWAIFDTVADGTSGLEYYIQQACSTTWALYPAGTTFLQFCNLYANNPPATYTNSIAIALGINTNTIISTILVGTPSTQAAPIPPLDPANLVVTPAVITLGASAPGGPYYQFVVQQGSYNRTWVRYNNSNGILGSGGQYINFIDTGPGTNEFDFTIICRNWEDPLILNAGVAPLWSTQKIQLETLYGQVGTPHTFIDPFGQQPHQGPYIGVFITKLVETIDASSTMDSPSTLYQITCLQAPPGPIVDTPTAQVIPPPVASELLVMPIIALGKSDGSEIQYFLVQQGQYTRTWTRYNSSQAIPGSPQYISYVDYGPGINEYDLKIRCMQYPPGSLPYEYGLTQSWAVQKASIENMYDDTNTLHFFLDPFGQYPTQDPLKGVYITKLVETIDPASTPNEPITYFDLTLLQTPPGPTVGQTPS